MNEESGGGRYGWQTTVVVNVDAEGWRRETIVRDADGRMVISMEEAEVVRWSNYSVSEGRIGRNDAVENESGHSG